MFDYYLDRIDKKRLCEWAKERGYTPVKPSSQKSFGGMAVESVDKNGTRYLWSYGTLVCSMDVDGTIHRHWDGWSATTAKHIASFVGMCINKKLWLDMKVEYSAMCA